VVSRNAKDEKFSRFNIVAFAGLDFKLMI